jgi:hypothetical protein
MPGVGKPTFGCQLSMIVLLTIIYVCAINILLVVGKVNISIILFVKVMNKEKKKYFSGLAVSCEIPNYGIMQVWSTNPDKNVTDSLGEERYFYIFFPFMSKYLHADGQFLGSAFRESDRSYSGWFKEIKEVKWVIHTYLHRNLTIRNYTENFKKYMDIGC